VHVVVGDGQDRAVVEQRQHHDHDRGHRVEVEDQNGQGDKQQHPPLQGFRDSVDRVTVHPLEDLAASLIASMITDKPAASSTMSAPCGRRRPEPPIDSARPRRARPAPRTSTDPRRGQPAVNGAKITKT